MEYLIKLGGHVPPSPSKYEVDFDDIKGAEETTEAGDRYIEQIVGQIPKISVSWTNIPEADANKIIEAVAPALIQCEYYHGGMKSDKFKCDSPKMTLKYTVDKETYFDVSLSLER